MNISVVSFLGFDYTTYRPEQGLRLFRAEIEMQHLARFGALDFVDGKRVAARLFSASGAYIYTNSYGSALLEQLKNVLSFRVVCHFCH